MFTKYGSFTTSLPLEMLHMEYREDPKLDFKIGVTISYKAQASNIALISVDAVSWECVRCIDWDNPMLEKYLLDCAKNNAESNSSKEEEEPVLDFSICHPYGSII